MISGDKIIMFVVAQDTERSGDDILQAYAISISYVVRLSSSRRLPLLTVIVSIEEKRTILQVDTAKPYGCDHDCIQYPWLQ